MPSDARFRDSSAYAIATIVCLAACALSDAALVLFIAKHVSTNAAPAAIWIKLHLLLRIVTAFSFLTWFDCLYANLGVIRGVTNHPRWWAIAGFFIPPFALFRPCEIGIELWRAPRKDGHPVIVYLWWAAFLQMIVVFVVGSGIYYVVSILAAVLAVAMVRVLTAHVDDARLEMQREERQLLRERRTVAAVRVPEGQPTPQPAASQGLAPHLAAIQEAAAQRAAERRGGVASPTAPAAFIASERVDRSIPDVPSIDASVSPRPQPAVPRPAPPRIILPVTPKRADVDASGGIWITVVASALGGTAILMFLLAARIAFAPFASSRIVAAVYVVIGILLASTGSFAARFRAANGTEGWALSAFAAIAVALANIIAAAWFVLS